jgi:hypothetical protein
MLLSIHIPKTAGVSFRRILAQLYQEDFLLKYWQMTDARGQVVSTVPLNVRCIHGHFSPESMLQAYPQAKLITWVRDPVERVISSYYHRLRDPDWQHPVTRELHEKKLSLVEFAALDLMRTEMSRYLGTRQPKDFAFIGRTECFETSLARFLQMYNFNQVPVPRENCNPQRTSAYYPVAASVRGKIAALNERDVAVYEEYCQSLTESEVVSV